MFSEIQFELWVVLCGAMSWTQSLLILSNAGYSVSLWYYNA